MRKKFTHKRANLSDAWIDCGKIGKCTHLIICRKSNQFNSLLLMEYSTYNIEFKMESPPLWQIKIPFFTLDSSIELLFDSFFNRKYLNYLFVESDSDTFFPFKMILWAESSFECEQKKKQYKEFQTQVKKKKKTKTDFHVNPLRQLSIYSVRTNEIS